MGLFKGSDLTEEEVNEIMSQLTAGMAASEIKFSDQVNRQATVSFRDQCGWSLNRVIRSATPKSGHFDYFVL